MNDIELDARIAGALSRSVGAMPLAPFTLVLRWRGTLYESEWGEFYQVDGDVERTLDYFGSADDVRFWGQCLSFPVEDARRRRGE